MSFKRFETKAGFGVFALIMSSSLALHAVGKERAETPFGIQLPLGTQETPEKPENQGTPAKKKSNSGANSKKKVAAKDRSMAIATEDTPAKGKKKKPTTTDMDAMAVSAPFGMRWTKDEAAQPSVDKASTPFGMSMRKTQAAQPSFIATTPAPQKKEEGTKMVRHPSRFQLGGNYAHLDLKPHSKSSFEGNLWGALGSYEYRPMDNFYGGVRVNWLEGNTDGSAGKRHIFYIDTQERFGYTFSDADQNVAFTFFSGLGFRHIGQHLHPSQGSSIKFKYNEFYVPVGFLSDVCLNSWFNWGFNLTWMPQVFPTVQISPLKGTNWSLTDQLSNFYVEMPLDFALTKGKRFHFIINPFYEHWKDGHSTAKASNGAALNLPGNTYNFWGVNVNFAYCF